MRRMIYSYSVSFIPDLDEGGYVVSVPALPGCHTQGDTFREAEANAREAIQVYLESLVETGEPIPREGRAIHRSLRVAL